MHIHAKASTVLFEQSQPRWASKFLAARDRGFTALWCYAKFAPAALHRGNFDERRDERAEAAGHIPEFGLSDSQAVIAGRTQRAPPAPWLVRS
jgi:hypothetical protein